MNLANSVQPKSWTISNARLWAWYRANCGSMLSRRSSKQVRTGALRFPSSQWIAWFRACQITTLRFWGCDDAAVRATVETAMSDRDALLGVLEKAPGERRDGELMQVDELHQVADL